MNLHAPVGQARFIPALAAFLRMRASKARQFTLSLTVSIVDSEQAFRETSAAWNELVRQCAACVFFRHEWFDAAWAWRKADATLFVMLARRDGELVGIFPLVRTQKKRRLLSVRCLEFLTVPDTQICDLIARPDVRSEVVAAFCAALIQERGQWDQLNLRYLTGNETIADQGMAALRDRGYSCAEKSQGPNLYVPLSGTWDAYYATRTRSLKKANNLAANRLKKMGAIDIECIGGENADPLSAQRALEHAIDISQRSWKKDTGNSLDQPGPNRFISVLTQHAAHNGWLSLWLLHLDGKALAMEYQLREAGNVYALRADFDAQCEEVSPGSHLMRTLLETLFGRELQRYYMGPGENVYKTRWTSDAQALHELTVYGKTLRGRLAHMTDELIKPAARAWRDRLQPKTPPPANKAKNEFAG